VKGFLITLAITSVAIVIVTYILPAVKFANPENHVPQLVILAVLIGLANSLIKPIAGILSFPINAMTLGLFGFVVNGLFLLLIAYVANTYFDVPFTIAGFPNNGLSVDVLISAIVAALLMTLITTVIGLVVPD
jgi:putative membrane protein